MSKSVGFSHPFWQTNNTLRHSVFWFSKPEPRTLTNKKRVPKNIAFAFTNSRKSLTWNQYFKQNTKWRSFQPKLATGPPRQATGPPRSGAGVGVGILGGAGDPWLDFLLDLEIYQDSTIVKFVFQENPVRS